MTPEMMLYILIAAAILAAIIALGHAAEGGGFILGWVLATPLCFVLGVLCYGALRLVKMMWEA